MGLDMYLKRKVYIGADFNHRNISGVIEIKKDGNPIDIDFNKVSEITESVGYWRKANQIHRWFVENTQDGIDECQETWIPFRQLTELKEICKEVLETKNTDLLPLQSGFFFGNTVVDDYYFETTKDTVEILEKLKDDGSYYYQSSW